MLKNKEITKWILRGAALLMILGYFVPSFFVSCASQEVNVSAVGLTVGYRSQGTTFSDPMIWVSFLLLLPIALIVLSFIKPIREFILSIIVLSAGALQSLLWLIMAALVASYADNNYCGFGYRFGFFYNILSILILLAGGGLLLYQTLTEKKTNLMGQPVMTGQQSIAMKPGTWRCDQCGSVNDPAWKFCMKCGKERTIAVVTAPAQQPQAATPLQDEQVCPKCGAKNGKDFHFCLSCGASLDQDAKLDSSDQGSSES